MANNQKGLAAEAMKELGNLHYHNGNLRSDGHFILYSVNIYGRPLCFSNNDVYLYVCLFIYLFIIHFYQIQIIKSVFAVAVTYPINNSMPPTK